MPKVNQNPAMDEAQEKADRKGFRTTVEHVTGGVEMEVGEGSGPEVGNPYDNDPLGEEYDAVTYKQSDYPKGMKKGAKY